MLCFAMQATSPVASYVRVLEHALAEGEAREAALRCV